MEPPRASLAAAAEMSGAVEALAGAGRVVDRLFQILAAEELHLLPNVSFFTGCSISILAHFDFLSSTLRRCTT